MYDSTSASDIPVPAGMVAGYVDGLYRWKASDWSRFPNAVHVGVAVSAQTNAGDVLDIERGDAIPEQGPAWVKMRKAAGHPCPTVYCSLADVPAVRQQLLAAGLRQGTDWKLWVAHYTNHPHSVGMGEAAVQYADPPGSGGHYDLSCVFDDSWPIPQPQPQPQPLPQPKEEPVRFILGADGVPALYVTTDFQRKASIINTDVLMHVTKGNEGVDYVFFKMDKQQLTDVPMPNGAPGL